MKTSDYNYFIPYRGKHIFFNGISKRFFIVSDENHEAMEDVVRHPEAYKDVYAPFISKIGEAGFVVDDDADEKRQARDIFLAQRDNDIYKLMILPTYDCNMRCWYCVQKHRGLTLTPESVDSIKRHIRHYLSHAGGSVSLFQLAWFGGEPLLAFDIIMDISAYARKVCSELGIAFSNTITTNGTLLTRGKLEAMKDAGFTFFQITLDGCKDDHDRVKRLDGGSSYELILRNICLMLETIPDAMCNLRFNYTPDNLRPREFIEGISERIPAVLRRRIELSFKKVWQVDDPKIDPAKTDELFDLARRHNFGIDTRNNFSICYVEFRNYNTIFPNGRVDKCDNVDPDTARGTIAPDGSIRWSGDLTFFDHTAFNEGESECYGCRYLPVCNGPCPPERERMWKASQYIKCRYQYPQLVCEDRIKGYCESYL